MEPPPSLFDDSNLFGKEQNSYVPYHEHRFIERSVYRKPRDFDQLAHELVSDARLVAVSLIDPVVIGLQTPSLTGLGRKKLNVITTAYLIAIAFALHEVKYKGAKTSELFSGLLVALERFDEDMESAVTGCIESCAISHDETDRLAKEHFPSDTLEEHEYRVVFQTHTEWIRTGLYETLEGADVQLDVFIRAAKEFYNELAKQLFLENR